MIFEGQADEGGSGERNAPRECRAVVTGLGSSQGILSCAVRGSGNDGEPGVLGVGPDRFDHRVQFIGAIDFARHAIGLARHEVVGFAEVMQALVCRDH